MNGKQWVDEWQIDVLLLQEVGHVSSDGNAFVAALSERLQFGFAYAPADVLANGSTHGLAILSRYVLAGRARSAAEVPAPSI